MRKLMMVSTFALLALACNTSQTKTGGESATAGSSDSMKTLYEKNLALVKANVSNFENKDLDAFFVHIADTVTWNSPMYGDTVTTKAHWMESIKYWTDNWDSLKLVNPIFLAGVDAVTNMPDGSVRYYGQWNGVHKATGNHTSVQIYEYMNFNADHKVAADGQYFDVGGLMNAAAAKK